MAQDATSSPAPFHTGLVTRGQAIAMLSGAAIMLSIAILDFIWTMQVFALVWMTTGGGPIYATEMLSTYTYKLAFSRYEFSLASASAVLLLILSMSMTYFYIKHQKAR